MIMRRLAFAAATAVLAGLPGAAPAQTAAEIVGTYTMTFTSRVGSDCDGDDSTLELPVQSISGDKLVFGDDHETETATYDPATKSFHFEKVSARPGENGKLTGRFTREPDAVRLTMTIVLPTCTAQLTGTRAAAHLAAAPPPSVTTPAGPAAPGAQVAAAPAEAGPKGMRDLLFYIPLGALLVGAGGVIGYLIGRPRKKPDAET